MAILIPNGGGGYTCSVYKEGPQVGPGSKFKACVEIWTKDTGSGIHCILRRYVNVWVPSGGSGFGGTNLTTAWAGVVSISTAGNYAIHDIDWKTLPYGGSEPVQYQHCCAYYSGSNYYESGVTTFTYTAPSRYTVAYNSNGGSGSMATDYIVYGKNYTTKANTFTKTGHTWKGWNENSAGTGVDWTDYVGVPWTWTYTKSITLYAQWKANTYYVYFNANGGSGAPSTQSYTYASSGSITLPSTKPTKSGYVFVGWGTSSTDTSADWSAGGSYAKNYAGNRTLYAIWRKAINITYNANGGSGAPSAQNGYAYNANTSRNVTLSSTKPTRTGYTFLGWSTSSSATSASYSAGTAYTFSDNTTLYAVWSENKLTVNYYSNYATSFEGKVTAKNEVNKDTNALIWSQYYYYDNAYSSGLINYTAGTDLYMKRNGYKSTAYWGTSENGGTLIYQDTGFATGQALAEAFGLTLKGSSTSIDIYAQWMPIELITMNFTYADEYQILNNESGAIFNDINVPFSLTTTANNSDLPFIYEVYYFYDNGLVGGDQYTVTGATDGLINLSGEDIKTYILSLDNFSSIDLVIKTYTFDIVDENSAEYHYSIPIVNYSKPFIKSMAVYRKNDDSTCIKSTISHPLSYDVNLCIPVLYFNDSVLSTSPDIVIEAGSTEQLGKYTYIIPENETSGSGTITLKYEDGLFRTSSRRLLPSSANEQDIKIYKDGSIQAVEFIEGDYCTFERGGKVYANDFIETDDGILIGGKMYYGKLIEK